MKQSGFLNKAERVQKERAEVMALLEEDPNFKIKEYVQEVLEQIGIAGNVSAENVVCTPPAMKIIREDVATYQLAGITMKQLTEFLNEIEKINGYLPKNLILANPKKFPAPLMLE